MAHVGRNDPCSCGSGKKYKKCCLAREQQQARERLVAVRAQELAREAELRAFRARRAAAPPVAEVYWDDDGLDDLSNSVLDLIRERRFDQALAACDRLLRDYSDVADGFERSARVHDALGNHAIAADFWQKALDFIEHPDRRDGYDEELIDDYRQRMRRSRQRASEAQPARTAEDERAR